MFSRRSLLILLATLAALALAWFVWSIRRTEARKLDPARLEAARQRWKDKGPRTYRLLYAVVLEGKPHRYEVKVADGKAISASVDGQAEPEERLHYYGMDRLFAYVERFLQRDEGDEQAVHLADFDAADGHIVRYQRHRLGTSEFVEIQVEALQ